jgi:hypothetical protein
VDQFPGFHFSADLTLLSFFLWGFVDFYVYSTYVDDIAIIHAMIIEAAEGVSTCTWADSANSLM